MCFVQLVHNAALPTCLTLNSVHTDPFAHQAAVVEQRWVRCVVSNDLQLLGGWLWQWLCHMLRGTRHTAATAAPVAAAAAAG
jgi:hypothetical protein